jgi:hypothetical protein
VGWQGTAKKRCDESLGVGVAEVEKVGNKRGMVFFLFFVFIQLWKGERSDISSRERKGKEKRMGEREIFGGTLYLGWSLVSKSGGPLGWVAGARQGQMVGGRRRRNNGTGQFGGFCLGFFLLLCICVDEGMKM